MSVTNGDGPRDPKADEQRRPRGEEPRQQAEERADADRPAIDVTETAAETAAETTAETAAETPVETPVETTVETTAETTAEAPAGPTDAAGGASPGGRPASLGELLAEARQRKGLELSDISQLTHVRQEYLRALEQGRYGDLPEDVYSRNYVRLYAQAVGIDPSRILEAYTHERRRAVGMSTLEERLEKERRGEVPDGERRSGLPFGSLLPTLALVVVLVALAVWGFNSLLFRPARGPAATPATAGATAGATTGAAAGTSSATAPSSAQPAAGGAAVAAGTSSGTAASTAANTAAGTPARNGASAPSSAGASSAAPAGVVGDAVEARTIQVSITTDPPGASVSIDGFALPGTTPIDKAPVTAREGRVVRVTLPGYQPLQRTVDLRQDRSLSYTLTPLAQASSAKTGASTAAQGDRAITPAAVSAGQIGINITARTWLEVYKSTTRNQGQRLVYATVDAGTHYVFDLPVYLHVGNAAGVDVVTDTKDLGPMGSPGAVVSRAFPAP